jgi:hypothetical protein
MRGDAETGGQSFIAVTLSSKRADPGRPEAAAGVMRA